MKAFFSPSLSKIIFVRGALRTRRVQNAFPRGAWERGKCPTKFCESFYAFISLVTPNSRVLNIKRTSVTKSAKHKTKAGNPPMYANCLMPATSAKTNIVIETTPIDNPHMTFMPMMSGALPDSSSVTGDPSEFSTQMFAIASVVESAAVEYDK